MKRISNNAKTTHQEGRHFANSHDGGTPVSCPRLSARKWILLGLLVVSVHVSAFAALRGRFAFGSSSSSSCAKEDGEDDFVEKARQVAEKKKKAPRFVLYRLIGNDMPPLQCPSQLRWNTQYALMHEPELEDCKKRWVLNNIINVTERALLIDMLLEAGYGLEDIIIRRVNFTMMTQSPRSRWGPIVSAQNEARNVAIRHGILSGARWILPFDGNHFITKEAWESIRKSADEADRKDFKYFKVPVHRLHTQHNSSFIHADTKFVDILPHIPLMIESQLAFRYDATERFLSGMVYGQQNKLELLARACGSAKDPNYVERCVCSNLGVEGQTHKSDPNLAAKCGYSLRLWFYPCNGTDPDKVFHNGLYRQRLRRDSRNELLRKIYQVVNSKSTTTHS